MTDSQQWLIVVCLWVAYSNYVLGAEIRKLRKEVTVLKEQIDRD